VSELEARKEEEEGKGPVRIRRGEGQLHILTAMKFRFLR
jgi:hypothetical protein